MQIGDHVKFVNELLEGIITRLIDEKTVGVSIEDGFEIPVLKREVMVMGSKALADSPDKAKVSNHKLAENLDAEIAILFENTTNNWFSASLLNNSHHDILLSVSNKKHGKYSALFAGRVEKGKSYLFNSLLLDELEKWGAYSFRIIFHEIDCETPRLPWFLEYTFKAKDFKQPKEILGKTAYVIALKPYKVEQFTMESISIGSKQTEPSATISITRPEEICDLHIHKLTESYAELSSVEALQLQLNHFVNLFEKAIALNYEKIIIIHGVGNGTLKQKIWKLVSGHESVKTFNEARKEKFGYGATEIFFK